MQAEAKGDFLYIYSGRNIVNRSAKEVDDPFSTVQAIRISQITSVEFDDNNFTGKIYISGASYPIYCTFGERNCHKINCFFAFRDIVFKAVGLDHSMIYELAKRDSEVSAAITRADYNLYKGEDT
jgi:hypothetical protein